MQSFFDTIIFKIFPLFLAIVFHEVSHGVAAYYLGDDTAKVAGRFKLHTHFDLWGSFLIPLGLYLAHAPFLIGYAKPVPVNPYKFKDPLVDMALVAIAGPLYNLIAGAVCAIALKNIGEGLLFQFLLNFSIVNFALFFFNLIPIPPLDGSRIIAAIIPKKFVMKYYTLEPFGFILIIGLELLTSGPLSQIFGCNIGLFHTFVEKPIRGILTMLLG